MEPKWNVKVHEKIAAIVDEEVLMEPKWNVKSDKIVLSVKIRAVLMEPKWNVKGVSERNWTDEWLGINGTKVECKVFGVYDNCLLFFRINGTKVECKGRGRSQNCRMT